MTEQAARGQVLQKQRPAVSLVVPAFNEEAVLGPVLTTLVQAFPHAEIILVSDGSTDNTPHIAAAYSPQVRTVHYHPNRGKGYAIRQGMLAATGAILVFTDADLPFGIDGIRHVLGVLAEHPTCDIAIAAKTRIQRGPAYRGARSVARLGIKLLTGLSYSDTQAGLKAFRRRAAHSIYARTRIDSFASDIEVLFIAERDGFRVKSVPLPLTAGFTRPSRFGLRQGIRLLRDVERIRRGRY